MTGQGRGRHGSRSAREKPEPATPEPGDVTAIREHPRKPGRFLLEVSGVRVGPVAGDALDALGVRIGRALSAERIEDLMAAVRRVACFDRATEALARRSRSSEELRRWLRQREFEPAHVDEAIERLVALGLLDDLGFARGFAHSRLVGRGFGPRRVAAELARRGVASATIAEVLAEERQRDEGEEGRRLEAAATRRLRALGALEPAVARRRLTSWLARRGFPLGDVFRVVESLVPGAPRRGWRSHGATDELPSS